MKDSEAFLPHFIDEEIYVIDQPISTTEAESESTAVEEPTSKYEQTESKSETKEAILSYRGENTKSVLLIVDVISIEEEAFLSKILGAVKLTLQECALLSLQDNDTPAHQPLIENFEADMVIQFGSTPVALLKGINPYKIHFVADKKVLIANDLSTIMNNVEKKKLLWGCLQQLFK